MPTQPETIAPEAVHTVSSRMAVWGLAVLIAGASALVVWQIRERPVAAAAAVAVAPDAGVVKVESTPEGAVIAIDGKTVGTTPWSAELKPGDYALTVAVGDVIHRVPLNVPSGRSVQRVFFNQADNSPAARESASTTVPVQPVAAIAPTISSASGGWISVSAPVDLKLYENGALIGSTKSDRIMLPVGRHVITVADPALGFETKTTMQVTAGAMARATIALPTAEVNINALPWADVTVDGKALGSTPLARIPLAIGPHDIVYANPGLGEKRQTVVVTLNGPNRASVDLNAR